MLHILPVEPDPRPLAYAEAVSRLASIRHALKLVEPFGAGPASDLADDESRRRRLGPSRRSQAAPFRPPLGATLVGATAAALEALLIEREDGRQPHEAATAAMVDEIRRELQDVAGIVLA